jgi:hypothetical protein
MERPSVFQTTFLWRHPHLESRLMSCVTLSLDTCGPFFYMQARAQNSTPPRSQSTLTKQPVIVLKLVEPLLKQGQTVWMDNFYNSPCLAKILKTVHKTDRVSKLKLNRKNVKKKSERHETVKRWNNSAALWSCFCHKVEWQKKHHYDFHISQSCSHDNRTVTIRGKETVKPISVLDYNQCKGGADLKDQLLHSYLIERKRMNKWYTKLFRRLLNTSILSAMIIYRNNMGKRTNQLSIRIQLAEGLFVKYANVLECKVPGRHSSDNTVLWLTERYFISKLPPSEKKARPQRRCVVCQKRGTGRTLYWCDAYVSETTTPSSISKVIKYYSFIILTSLLCQN